MSTRRIDHWSQYFADPLDWFSDQVRVIRKVHFKRDRPNQDQKIRRHRLAIRLLNDLFRNESTCS